MSHSEPAPQSVAYRHIALPARRVLPDKLGPLALPVCIEVRVEWRTVQSDNSSVENTAVCQVYRRFLEINWVDEWCSAPPAALCAGLE